LVSKLCSRGPQSIAHLTSGSKITRQAITKHLCALERAGVVESRRVGRERIWEIRTSQLKQARGYLDQISRQWDDAIERLRMLVEQAAD
jgi:DNA-binding transcriptional ArsR family regulator